MLKIRFKVQRLRNICVYEKWRILGKVFYCIVSFASNFVDMFSFMKNVTVKRGLSFFCLASVRIKICHRTI